MVIAPTANVSRGGTPSVSLVALTGPIIADIASDTRPRTADVATARSTMIIIITSVIAVSVAELTVLPTLEGTEILCS